MDDRGNAPTCENAAVSAAVPPQPVFVAIMLPLAVVRVSCGLARVPETPNEDRVGPTALISNCSVPNPPMTKPAIRTFDPVPTADRADRLISRDAE